MDELEIFAEEDDAVSGTKIDIIDEDSEVADINSNSPVSKRSPLIQSAGLSLLLPNDPDTLTSSEPPSRPPSDLRSGSEMSFRMGKGLVSYGPDEESDEEESGTEEDSGDIGLAKESVVNLGLFDPSSILGSVASGSPSSSVEGGDMREKHLDGVRLPPEPDGRCSKQLQEKIARMIEKKENYGWDVNEHVQKKKEFRNPSIYEKLISFIGIEEHGTNYPKHLYDPTIWGPESYYENLAKQQKDYHDKKEKEKQKRAHVEFISGTKKVPTNVIAAAPDGKRSKWDIGPVAK